MLPYNAFLWIASYLCQLRHWNTPEGEGCLRVPFLWLFYWGHHKRRLSGFLSISHWTIGTYDGYLPVLSLATWVGHSSLTVISRACKPAEIIRQSIHTQSPLWTFQSSETPLQVSSYSVCQCCTCSVFWLWFRALVYCHCLVVPVLTFHKPRISFPVPAACVKIDMFSFLVVDMLVAVWTGKYKWSKVCLRFLFKYLSPDWVQRVTVLNALVTYKLINNYLLAVYSLGCAQRQWIRGSVRVLREEGKHLSVKDLSENPSRWSMRLLSSISYWKA